MKLPDATRRKFIYPDPTPARAVKVKRSPKGRKSGKARKVTK